jgi:hypothetical protein
MTGADIARRTRSDQGLAQHVEDQGVLAQIAALLNMKSADPDSRRSSRRSRPDRDLQAS